jgi:hypothetical protein
MGKNVHSGGQILLYDDADILRREAKLDVLFHPVKKTVSDVRALSHL